jgi:conjugative transfer region protein TrbK
VDPRRLFRVVVAGLLRLTLFGAAIALHDDRDSAEPVRVMPAVIPADPLAAELARCRKLGAEAANNTTCEKAWAENRARYFAPSHPSPEK